jgi:regulatory protein
MRGSRPADGGPVGAAGGGGRPVSSGRGGGADAPRRDGRTLTARAVGYLSRREHSRLELQRKLEPHAREEDDLPALLDRLEQRGWLSEKRMVEQLVAGRSRRYGASRIAGELRRRGVAAPLIEDAEREARRTELVTARAVWAQRFGSPAADALERAKQMRFLRSRGFSADTIRRVVRDREDG